MVGSLAHMVHCGKTTDNAVQLILEEEINMKLTKGKKFDKMQSFTMTPEELNAYETKYNSLAYHSIFGNITSHFSSKDRELRRKAYNKLGDNVNKENKDKEVVKEMPGWHFIPLETYRIVQMLAFVKEYTKIIGTHNTNRGLRFLDAGCGPGNVILQARAMAVSYYGHCHGVELDKEAVELGKILCGQPKGPKKMSRILNNSVHIFNNDIVTFRYYKKYGIIYYYCPIKLYSLQVLFEERLEDLVNVGTIIMPNLKQSSVAASVDDRFKSIRCFRGKHKRDNRNSQIGSFLVKTKGTPRLHTQLKDLKDIPDKYQSLAKAHIKRVEKNNAKRTRSK